ncbi:hypothetical protein [Parasulfitobacter algicola]|uniref:Uncharacterized protein n=1 Tax=Parasulfitobacter algicola TaxID=2614809 RepID=A0ABX2ISM1_9RHOB|nr:hypothetical protein [Sulfitobacter algicola]NSX55545.1 hypothetical protein [Sulfitobacter algicola]
MTPKILNDSKVRLTGQIATKSNDRFGLAPVNGLKLSDDGSEPKARDAAECMNVSFATSGW